MSKEWKKKYKAREKSVIHTIVGECIFSLNLTTTSIFTSKSFPVPGATSHTIGPFGEVNEILHVLLFTKTITSLISAPKLFPVIVISPPSVVAFDTTSMEGPILKFKVRIK